MGSTWRTAWGRTTWRKLAARLKPRADAASHWPLFTAWIPVFRVPATDTAKITEKEITATATGSMSEEAKMTKFTMRSTTRLGALHDPAEEPCRPGYRPAPAAQHQAQAKAQ